MSARLLRHIAMVTHCVPDLDPVIAGWTQYLGYRKAVIDFLYTRQAHVEKAA